MTRLILFLLAAAMSWRLSAHTSTDDGTFYHTAIPVTFSSGKSVFTDVRNTASGPPYYDSFRYLPRSGGDLRYTRGGAVFYRMEISVSCNVLLHNWNSRIGFSSLFLLREAAPDEPADWTDGQLRLKRVAVFEEGDFLSPDFDPVSLGMPENSSRGLACLYVEHLPAGTYYIISAGYKYTNGSSSDGELGTTVIADFLSGIPEEPEMKPEAPNDSPVQYQYDRSGNRIKTIKRQQ